ncbi:MAG: hypothetical protein FWD83_05790 [Promicromonosporaceae bacterium]|nr:hypothetical protein [Promicromonosporaceae bacterium]
MVAQFIRLRLTLLGNTLRKSVWQTIGIVVSGLYALAMVTLAVGLALFGGLRDAALTGEIITLVGALLVLAWWVIPVFLFGVDATLDPQRFATYAIPRRKLLVGLAAAAIISVPGVATLLAFGGVALAWVGKPEVLFVALVGAGLGAALCVIGSRALTTLLAPMMESRRSREVLSLVAIVAILAISPALTWTANSLEGATVDAAVVRTTLADAAAFLGWTPLGAPWGAAQAAYAGDWAGVAARLAIAVGALAVAWFGWDRALRRSLETPPHRAAGRGRVKGLGLLDRLPATPTGAIAARTLIYWRRDPRYSVGFIAVLAMPLIFGAAGQAGGGEAMFMLVILAPMTGWLLGLTISNDVAFDDTAFALHIVTGVTGRADRWGRALPTLAIGLPLVTGFAILSVALNDRWAWLPPLIGLSLGMLAAATGLASATSARWLYPVAKPGESPFKQPQGAVGATLLAQGISISLLLLVSLPTMVLAVVAMVMSGPVAMALGWATLLIGPAIGLAVLFGGIRWGAGALERRAPEILQRIKDFP